MRASRACTLPGAPAPAPTADGLFEPIVGSPYFGREPIREKLVYLGRPIIPEEPLEDPADGCPGGWYRTPFVDDLDDHSRRRTTTGDRVSNPAFDNADWQTQEAVLYLEAQQEQAIAYVDRAIEARHERARQAAEKRAKLPTASAVARPRHR